LKWIILILSLMTLLFSAASGQMNPVNQPDQQGQSGISMTAATSGGAPTPVTPSSADALNLQIPSASASTETPSAQERTQQLIVSSQEAAYAQDAAVMGGSQATGGAKTGAFGSTSGTQGMAAGYTSSGSAMYVDYSKVITPAGIYAPNRLYVSYAPQTVAGCNLYASLPLWMNTAGRGSIWFYEWYPSGMLDTNYAGYVYSPGWYKRWFFADTPGWHIMQFYCSGWSNYVYVYVYAYGPSGNWVNPYPEYDPAPHPQPYWDSEITYTYPPAGQVYST